MTQIISYRQIEDVEEFRPQNGMNFRTKNKNYSIVLMSVLENAPYEDEISEDGKEIIYEGHDLNKRYCKGKDPKQFDQPLFSPYGNLTENGKFAKAANFYKDGFLASKCQVDSTLLKELLDQIDFLSYPRADDLSVYINLIEKNENSGRRLMCGMLLRSFAQY